MHYSSLVKMAEFKVFHEIDGKTVVDIGSRDINGTYKTLFPDAEYIGVDIVPGENVDVIMGSKEWDELEDIDIVISGQTLEHVEDRPKFMADIYDILKPGGLICIIAPSAGPSHEPPWYGNVSEEDMIDLVSEAGFSIQSCTINPIEPWKDCYCIAIKEKKGGYTNDTFKPQSNRKSKTISDG